MIRLVLPLPENRANSRWHWRTEKRKRDAYMWAATTAEPLSRPTEPLQRVRVDLTFYVWNLMDPLDNLPARAKWPMDWLVAREYIADDSPKVVVSCHVGQQIDRKNQRLEITLEPIE